MNEVNCTHSDEERCVVETGVVHDVRKAIKMEYAFVNMFEFWEHSVTCIE